MTLVILGRSRRCVWRWRWRSRGIRVVTGRLTIQNRWLVCLARHRVCSWRNRLLRIRRARILGRYWAAFICCLVACGYRCWPRCIRVALVWRRDTVWPSHHLARWRREIQRVRCMLRRMGRRGILWCRVGCCRRVRIRCMVRLLLRRPSVKVGKSVFWSLFCSPGRRCSIRHHIVRRRSRSPVVV